jgi:hypothetical protein
MFHRKKNNSSEDLQHQYEKHIDDKITLMKDTVMAQLDQRLHEFTGDQVKAIRDELLSTLEAQNTKYEMLIYSIFQKQFEAKLKEQREEVGKQMNKTFTDFETKIQKEKNELVLERARMKLELEAEYP